MCRTCLNKFDFGATLARHLIDGTPWVEQKLSSTASVELLVDQTFSPHLTKTAAPNWFRWRSFAVVNSSVWFGMPYEWSGVWTGSHHSIPFGQELRVLFILFFYLIISVYWVFFNRPRYVHKKKWKKNLAKKAKITLWSPTLRSLREVLSKRS